jgi:zinc protease
MKRRRALLPAPARRALLAAGAALAIGAALAVAAALGAAPAAAVQATPPPPQPMQELRFPAYSERTLANGLRVVMVERHANPEVDVQLLLPAGALYTPAAAKAGLPGATAALLTKGTASRSAQQIAGAIDGIGGTLEAVAGTDFTSVSARVTSDQLAFALDLLADVALHPSFPAAEVERWRRQTVSSLAVSKANASWLVGAAFDRAVFGSYPYGLPAGGTPESIGALSRDDVVAFHRAHYLPNGAFLALSGDFQPAAAMAAVEQRLGGWAKGETVRPPALDLPAYGKPRIVVIDKPDAVQTEIRIGQVAHAYTDPNLFTGRLYAAVLGGGSSARLFREIRMKRGLSYGAYCAFTEYLTTGVFRVFTSTKTATTADALRLALDLVGGMAREPVPAAELDEAKTFLNGSFPFEIETAPRITNRILSALAHGLGRDFLDTYRDHISAVSAADIQRFAAARIHPEQMVVVLVGNAGSFAADVKKQFGDYEIIPVAEFDPLARNLRHAAAPGGR